MRRSAIALSRGRPRGRRIAYTAAMLAPRLLCLAVVAVIFDGVLQASSTEHQRYWGMVNGHKSRVSGEAIGGGSVVRYEPQ
jgi:hypothetical protein